MPPDLVIRSSGVWNSRAPLENYVYEHRRHNRTYYLLSFATQMLQSELQPIADTTQPARGALDLDGRPKFARRLWRRLERGWGRETPEGDYRVPTVAEVQLAALSATYDAREAAIVSIVSSFETFVWCWALNYLLARLERGDEWTDDEREVATALSPEHQTRPAPGWPWVVARVPLLEDALRELPHVFVNANTGTRVENPISDVLNAYGVMRFWRDFRNKVVHSGGIVSKEFYREHFLLYEELRAPRATSVAPLTAGERVDLGYYSFAAVATTHFRVATWMNDILITISSARRGHRFAPARIQPDASYPQFKPPPRLLMEGDHGPSLQWAENVAFT